MNFISGYLRRIQSHVRGIAKTKTSDHSIALGIGIATFISILPTPIINLWLGVLAVLLVKSANKYALFATLLFWNPITLVPFILLSISVGNIIFGADPTVMFNIVILDHVYNFTRRFLLGSFIVAIPSSILIYIGTRIILKLFRIGRNNKHILK
jgi:uncharacterized protein (DUF2062 family)